MIYHGDAESTEFFDLPRNGKKLELSPHGESARPTVAESLEGKTLAYEGVDFVSGDADFGAEAEFSAVGEAGGGVVEGAGGVDLELEFGGVCFVGGDDAVAVFGGVVVDVGDGGVEVGDDFYGEDEVEVFGVVVVLCCFGEGDVVFAEDGVSGFAAAEFDTFFNEGLGDSC